MNWLEVTGIFGLLGGFDSDEPEPQHICTYCEERVTLDHVSCGMPRCLEKLKLEIHLDYIHAEEETEKLKKLKEKEDGKRIIARKERAIKIKRDRKEWKIAKQQRKEKRNSYLWYRIAKLTLKIVVRIVVGIVIALIALGIILEFYPDFPDLCHHLKNMGFQVNCLP